MEGMLLTPLKIDRDLIHDAHFVSHASRYLTRKYGRDKGEDMLRNNEINDIDFKTIESMCKLKTAYTAIRNKRVQAVVIAFKDDPNISAITPKTQRAANKPPKVPNESKPSRDVLVCVCKAIKMNGQPCGAKSKNGLYCARHSKK